MKIFFGNFVKSLFRDSNSGASCFVIKTNTDEITCCGNIPSLPTQFPIVVHGSFKENKDYGKQFEVRKIEFKANAETSHNFICGGFVKSIKQIEKKIMALGDDCVASALRDDIDAFSESLSDENKKRFSGFFFKIREIVNILNVFEYIHPFGGTYSYAEKICEQYETPLDDLKENVYAVGERVGMNFFICDKIFKHENGFEYDKKRLIALCVCAVNRIIQSGSTYCLFDEIFNFAKQITNQSAYPNAELNEPMLIQALFFAPKLVVEQGDCLKIFRKDLYYQEKNIVANLNRMINDKVNKINDSISFATIKAKIINEAAKNGVCYSQSQKDSFNFLKTSGVKILTGGPGTGKTTVMNGLIKIYQHLFPDKEILLCAPTGRAAQKLSEATGMDASTLHRALNIKPYKDMFTSKDETNPIDAELIIVDEMSMTDTTVFSILLGAVKSSATLILCGDPDQLPSVGAGNILKDLIKSKKFETNILSVIYRQADESTIIKNALTVNFGSSNLTNAPDFQIIECNTENDMSDEIKRVVDENKNVNDPFALQILSSTKKGKAGTVALNKSIKEICNPSKTAVIFGDNRFSVGDKIIVNKNDYSKNLVNGDVGIITKANTNEITLSIKGSDDITIDRTSFSDISLGYAITVHKSQGTEYKTVVIVLPKNPSIILKRNLLYTAITRAKEKVILITQPFTIQKTVNTPDTALRHTDIQVKLKDGVCKKIYNFGGNNSE